MRGRYNLTRFNEFDKFLIIQIDDFLCRCWQVQLLPVCTKENPTCLIRCSCQWDFAPRAYRSNGWFPTLNGKKIPPPGGKWVEMTLSSCWLENLGWEIRRRTICILPKFEIFLYQHLWGEVKIPIMTSLEGLPPWFNPPRTAEAWKPKHGSLLANHELSRRSLKEPTFQQGISE